MPYIGHLHLQQVHDDTLMPFVRERKKQGRKNKTFNASLSVVRHILNLAARKWRDDRGRTWLEAPEFVFTYRRGKQHEPHAIETMNNNGWQNARQAVDCRMSACMICGTRWACGYGRLV